MEMQPFDDIINHCKTVVDKWTYKKCKIKNIIEYLLDLFKILITDAENIINNLKQNF